VTKKKGVLEEEISGDGARYFTSRHNLHSRIDQDQPQQGQEQQISTRTVTSPDMRCDDGIS
jgi:hypothetical protein